MSALQTVAFWHLTNVRNNYYLSSFSQKVDTSINYAEKLFHLFNAFGLEKTGMFMSALQTVAFWHLTNVRNNYYLSSFSQKVDTSINYAEKLFNLFNAFG